MLSVAVRSSSPSLSPPLNWPLLSLCMCSSRDITVGKSSRIHTLYLKLVSLGVDDLEANHYYSVKSSTALIRMLVAFLDMSVEQSSNIESSEVHKDHYRPEMKKLPKLK